MNSVLSTPIELKSADDEPDATALVTKALEGLTSDVNAKLAKVTSDLAAVQAKLNRPGAANDNRQTNDNDANAPLEAKAFTGYMRKGIERLQADEQKAMTVSSDTAGGFLAPPEFAKEILKAIRQFSPIRQYARVVATGSQEVLYPRRTSSTVATWLDENEDTTGTETAYEQVSISPKRMGTHLDLSSQLLEDSSYPIESEVSLDIGETFGIKEGLAFVEGTGGKQPVGLFTATGIAEIKTGAAASFPAANPADVMIGMYHALPNVHAQNGVWIMNRTTLGVMRTWKDTTGRYLVIDPISEGAPITLLGRPIVECLDVDDLGANKYPVMFGDLQGYRIVDRVGLTIIRDPYSLATKGQVRLVARRRVGSDLTHPDRFVKLKCAV